MDLSQVPSTDVKERYHQLALDIVKISTGIRDATREIVIAQKASTFDETVLHVLKNNVDVLMTRNSKQLELLELMSQLKKDPANTDMLSGKDYDEALNDAVKEIDRTSNSTERVAKLLESSLATLKSMKEAGLAPPLERPLTPPNKLGEGKPLMTGGAEAVGHEGLRKPFTYNEYSCVHASVSFLSAYYPFLRPMLDTIPNTATFLAEKITEIERICEGLGIKTIYMEGYDPAEPDRLGDPGIPYEIVHDYCRVNGWGGIMIQKALDKKKDSIGHALPVVRENLPMFAGPRLVHGIPVYLLTTSYPDHREKEVSLQDLAYENETFPLGKKKFNKIGPSAILWICKEVPLAYTLEGRRMEIARELDPPEGLWYPTEGKKAVLTGLVSRPYLNGKEVLVVKLDGDRWLVQMGEEELMRIKQENLTDVGAVSF